MAAVVPPTSDQAHPPGPRRPLVFFAIVLSIWTAMHGYAFERLVRGPAVPWPYNALLTAIIVIGALAVFPAFARRLPRPWAGWLHLAAFGWMGALFLTDALLAVGDIVRVLIGLRATVEVARDQALVTGVVSLLATGRAVWNARQEPPLRRVTVRPDGWPAELDGLSIVQLTDVHVSADTTATEVQRLVDRVNALAPDLIALTGDMVDGEPAFLRAAMAPLADLKAPLGVYAVTGNHEYYSDGDAWILEFERLGFRVLQNEHVTLQASGSAFVVAGVPDWRGGEFGERHQPRLALALEGRDSTLPVLLLAHQPRQFAEAARLGVALQLSGHTHGGQIWPFTLLVAALERPMAGLHNVGAAQLYISRGTRYWGPPMRLGAPQELTQLVLSAGGN
jgi:predicted MPP superfamily phosphohydrolase